MISMSLSIYFQTNGVQTILQQPIHNKVSVDTWNCVAVDPPTSSYWGMYAYSILTPSGLFVQIRDTLVNELKCDTSSAVSVRLDHYMFQKEQQNVFYRQQQTLPIEDYNNRVEIEFASDGEYQNFRKNQFVNDTTYSLIVLSFLDAGGKILYEVSQYGKAYLGCITQQTLKIYDNEMCATIIFEDDAGCRKQYQDPTLRNHISLFYTHQRQFKFLGFYNFVQEVNYSDYKTTICFTCDQYDPTYQDMYEGKTCSENFSLMTAKLKLQSGRALFRLFQPPCDYIALKFLIFSDIIQTYFLKTKSSYWLVHSFSEQEISGFLPYKSGKQKYVTQALIIFCFHFLFIFCFHSDSLKLRQANAHHVQHSCYDNQVNEITTFIHRFKDIGRVSTEEKKTSRNVLNLLSWNQLCRLKGTFSWLDDLYNAFVNGWYRRESQELQQVLRLVNLNVILVRKHLCSSQTHRASLNRLSFVKEEYQLVRTRPAIYTILQNNAENHTLILIINAKIRMVTALIWILNWFLLLQQF
ncbi:Conserved_hypothetical protein [Hexamita inflata]|uniref:Uncharacterized protein n=1 Tax=Hexamita inflata TaxID=28002 RepID=A0AA86NXG4_9EUKA|nr:Conserved hypothetical protein [Hexamita inflata]